MDYVRFGATGMKVSRICLGCMSYGKSADPNGPKVNDAFLTCSNIDSPYPLC